LSEDLEHLDLSPERAKRYFEAINDPQVRMPAEASPKDRICRQD
jgi:hypothetical protein